MPELWIGASEPAIEHRDGQSLGTHFPNSISQPMLETVDAVRFDRVMSNGRTRPVLLSVEHATRGEIEVVAKFSAGQNIGANGLVREAVAAMLAADLNLPVPEPFVVHVSDAFIDTIADREINDLLRKSIRVGFGSSRLPGGNSTWPTAYDVPKKMRAAAAEVFAFDALIQNADRKPSNPNLQIKGDEIAIFDHELAFITEGVIGWQPPWVPGSLEYLSSPDAHIFQRALKGHPIDLERFSASWRAISNERLTVYLAALPTEWSADPSFSQKVVTFVRDLRDNLDPALMEIKRVLA